MSPVGEKRALPAAGSAAHKDWLARFCENRGIKCLKIFLPADVKAEAEAMRDAIAAGTYHPFTGPINKQDGSAWLAEGATAPDGDLLGMMFYVEGITGEIPS